MGINYKPLWKLLIDREVNKTMLREQVGIAASTLSRMNKNQYVSLEVLVKICVKFNCTLDDIIEIAQD